MSLIRWVAVTVLLGAVLSTDPAVAATKVPATSLHVHAAAASFRVGSPVTVTGTVRPKSLKQVTIEGLVGKRWVVVGHVKPSAAGTFSTTVKAPKTATTWDLRAVRAKSAEAKEGISGVLKVHVVKTAYTVTAAAPAHVISGTSLVVTGKVSAKGAGTVWLQTLVGKTWHNVASAKLSKTSTYKVSAKLAVGTHRLRVSKAATTKIAGGLSKTLTVVVANVLHPLPTITSLSLLTGIAEVQYRAQLTATGGVAPYTWAAAGLPAGLTLASDGLITGVVAVPVTAALSVVAMDATGAFARAVVSVSFALSPSVGNTVVGWGTAIQGSLGPNVSGVTSTPVAIPGVTGITAVTGTYGAGFALRFNGAVYAWGAEFSGQLGDNLAAGASGRATPVQIAGLPPITALSGGMDNVLALAADGTVWGWGDNHLGGLGDGTQTERDVPTQVPNLAGVTAIASMEAGSVALKSDGTVWTWGSDFYGALGDGGTTATATPARVQSLSLSLSHVTAITAAGNNAAALLSDGTVWEWGYGTNGVIGGSSTVDATVPVRVGNLSGVTEVALQTVSGYALDNSGALWSWGFNADGELGVGDGAVHTAPVKVPLSSVVSITGTASSVAARLGDGTLRAWGAGVDGQLGNGQVADSSSPVPVTGVSHAVAAGGGYQISYAVVSPG
jgi:alpha-tubulin suppressor-like RCC1 family protein